MTGVLAAFAAQLLGGVIGMLVMWFVLEAVAARSVRGGLRDLADFLRPGLRALWRGRARP